MEDLLIRRANAGDVPALDKLLYQVHKVHSDARPDLFKPGKKKYTDEELALILQDESRPIFVAEWDGEVCGYAFCIHQQHEPQSSMAAVKTLYIDDLCVDEEMRGAHIGTALYEFVLEYAKEHDYYNVTLNVWADNPNAVKFYEKLGLRVQKLGMEKIL